MLSKTNILSVFLPFLFLAEPINGPQTEREWVDAIVHQSDELVPSPKTIFYGTEEYQLPDGRRVDIYTDRVVYEVDWANKWPEGIGQALGYSVATNKSPGLVLLIKKGQDEYFNAALSVVTSLREKGYDFRFYVLNVENGKTWNLNSR